MRSTYLFILLLLLLSGCSKDEVPGKTDALGIATNFAPPANAPAAVKELFDRYQVWVRMDFNDWKEVTNGVLASDPINRWGVGKIHDTARSSAIQYAQALLSNVSPAFAKRFFPLEMFFVKSYSGSFWAKDITSIGRSRLIICWPNQMQGALPITDAVHHYYQDSVLTRSVWSAIGQMVAARIEQPINEFVIAGKAYDNGEALDKIWKQYELDGDAEARDAARIEVARNGGFITIGGANSFDNDFTEWMRLLATESYDHIKRQYLDNSPARARKYEVIIRYFKSYGWDIQQSGNQYRQWLDQ
ncbi:hypothetical protein KTO58_00600 [Chitinophaga pendula]|uniref:hypothetical protein n=1 Tax=Chitinophaga TaxID=79328 RepID=UPI000BB083E9|nr:MULTISPECIES: hypothetical protein [Chitinophaga]ASZ14641.1 hypothetical protein CK934_28650 [Chitinophaga sp. MD30]UCJ07707.1 hypothetical protein KTO58_00600 [Chitinophaga pendula]